MKSLLQLLSKFIFILFIHEKILAAACCGGGFATPSLIAGDDKAVLTTSYMISEVAIDNVDSQGVWRKWNEHQSLQTFRIEGAHIFSDLWQAGFTVPMIQRRRLNQVYSGLGDIAGMVGYEYLPDWDYNPYRPKGVGFLQVTLPTGKSKADSEIGGLDSRGNGFWAVGIGTLLTKAWGNWDTFSTLEIHRSFGKNINNSQISGTLKPGMGGNFGIGTGYSIGDYRFGTSITWTYEDAVNLEYKNNLTTGAPERYATALLSASYMIDNDWSGTISCNDQTLFGDPINTSLGRGIAFQLQRRWSR